MMLLKKGHYYKVQSTEYTESLGIFFKKEIILILCWLTKAQV